MAWRWFGWKKKSASTEDRNSRLDRQTPIITELAKICLSAAHEMEPNFSRAFFRFDCGPSDRVSKASIQTEDGVNIVDVMLHKSLFSRVGELGAALFEVQDQKTGTFLLILSSPAEYEILFDYSSRTRWQFNKMNGGSGLPEGF